LGIARVRRLGLVAALGEYIAAIADSGLRIDLDATGYMGQAVEAEEALYRIAQEALGNAVKHSRGRSAMVRLWVEDAAIRLTVADDGVGFALPLPSRTGRQPGRRHASDAPAAAGGGLGLTTMRERAAARGGTVRIITAPGQGATFEVVMPRMMMPGRSWMGPGASTAGATRPSVAPAAPIASPGNGRTGSARPLT
jgi:signal transduction histidine kinase